LIQTFLPLFSATKASHGPKRKGADIVITATETNQSAVPPDEVARRIAEYRRLGFEHRAMPHIIYHGPWVLCPWPGCGFRLTGIDFQVEMGDPAMHAAYLTAWWQGPGLVGRCPGCQNYVLFGMSDKKCVADPQAPGLTVLPDDWFQRAYVS
jgi:hypothetical protein